MLAQFVRATLLARRRSARLRVLVELSLPAVSVSNTPIETDHRWKIRQLKPRRGTSDVYFHLSSLLAPGDLSFYQLSRFCFLSTREKLLDCIRILLILRKEKMPFAWCWNAPRKTEDRRLALHQCRKLFRRQTEGDCGRDPSVKQRVGT